MSKAYQAYLGQGLTRSLVAMRAEESSTRTVGCTQLQLLYGLISPDRVFDRLLSGPTNDVWIYPVDPVPSRNWAWNSTPELESLELKRTARE